MSARRASAGLLVGSAAALAVALGPTACSDTPRQAASPAAWVEIGSARVAVDVAATPEQQTRGLSGRASLEWGTGMVFLYEKDNFQRFWMIDMNFPIDMVWIRDGRIAGIHHRVPVPEPGTPSSQLPRYGIEELVDTVLEVPAGYAQANGWGRGDAVLFGGEAAARSGAR